MKLFHLKESRAKALRDWSISIC